MSASTPPPPPPRLPPQIVRQPHSGERRFAERRFEGPRRVKNGLKLVSKEGPVARNPLAERWMQTIESLLSPEIMQQGLEYARSGQIVSMQTLAGEIDGKVQGSALRAYVARVHVPAFSETQWQAIIDVMAAEAIHVAKLLAGELPPGLDEIFSTQQAALLPPASALKASCTCATGEASRGAVSPCKHIAALAHMFADHLSESPLLILTLLGLPSDRLIERLRQARTLHTHGVASAHGEAHVPLSQLVAPPLESSIEDFWRGSGERGGERGGEWGTDAANLPVPREQVRHALLRRLGQSPLKGKFPMVGLLASIYDTVSEAAKARADAGNDAAPSASADDADGDDVDDADALDSDSTGR